MSLRKRNKIEMLKLGYGDWCLDNTQLQQHAREYFLQLFGPSEVPILPLHTNQSTCHDEDKEFLTQNVELWESTKALNSMKLYKVRGPDRFQPFFYQKYWNIVGPSIY